MILSNRWTTPLTGLLLSAMLLACGGGGDNGPAPAPGGGLLQAAMEPAFPATTAQDGRNWINYRRAQVGLPSLTQNTRIDQAAQGHSDYQKVNNTIDHVQILGNPGFTGATLPDRLSAAGYQFTFGAYGEVISATGDTSGFSNVEQLITAIYHRFVIFEPMFKEIGTGAATIPGGYTYFTSNFTANNGNGRGITPGTVVFYPVRDQTGLPTEFFSDQERPDPVSNQDLVGYPISVHANLDSVLTVSGFSIRPRGGAALVVKTLSATLDPEHTPHSAAAIIPLAVLLTNTTYDVEFSGTVDNIAVTKNWSFTTK